MNSEQMDMLDAIEDNLPVKQIIELERQARRYRINLAEKQWEFQCDLISMYMNFPFLY